VRIEAGRLQSLDWTSGMD